MPQLGYVAVHRRENRLIFRDRVHDKAVRDFLSAFQDARYRGYSDLLLDFSNCDRAYPDGMLPIICVAQAARAEGIDFEVVLPEDPTLSRLFLNTNWVHFLDPSEYSLAESFHERHLSVQQYRTFEEQQQTVDAMVDVVMRNMELERDVIAGLEWSLNEITDNVLNHAESENGGFVQVSTFRENHKIAFVVADSGRGILSSMREGYPSLSADGDALGEAVKRGVTRSPEGQGNGLAGTLRVSTLSQGSFALTSGGAQLTVFCDPGSENYGERLYRRPPSQRFPGTVVSAELGTDTEFRLIDAIGFGNRDFEVWDRLDAIHTGDSGEYFILCVADETHGFGTRGAGVQVRTKAKNLLNADPSKRLVLDWSGIPLISSSFADETIGKLFVDLGPLTFNARIQNIRMESLVQSLIDQAIMQRVSQAMASADSEP